MPSNDEDQFERIFVRCLCCWKKPNVAVMFERRDPQEYRKALNTYLNTNSKRKDSIGRAGCEQARMELKRLDKTVNK